LKKKKKNTPILSKFILKLGRAPFYVESLFIEFFTMNMDCGIPWNLKNHIGHSL